MAESDINRELLSWAGGFFDGEGTIFASKNVARITISLTQAEQSYDLLQKFQKAVCGLGSIWGPRKKQQSHHALCWVFQTRKTEHVIAICAMLWEFVGKAKREQISRALSFYVQRARMAPRHIWARGRCARGHDITRPENVFIRSNHKNSRICRICRDDKMRSWYIKNRRLECRLG